jgi:hypothetical protein
MGSSWKLGERGMYVNPGEKKKRWGCGIMMAEASREFVY